MKIKILGTSGVKSQQLERIIRGVVKELGIDAEIEEVKDFNNIMEYPILAIPGLVIDEKLVCSGRVPTRAEVNRFVTTELKGE
jgi:small redox-active disulfide protein 2